MQLRAIASWTLLLLLMLVGRAEAWFSPTLVTPSSLEFAHTPYDVPGPTYRIEIRNDGDDWGYVKETSVIGDFVIVGKGGSLDVGQTAYWDIACKPSQPDNEWGYFDIFTCGADCPEDELMMTVYLSCAGGPLAPAEPNHYIFAHPYSTAQDQLAFTNDTAAAITVTSVGTANAAFHAEAIGAPLPRTLAPGEAIDVRIVFDATDAEIIANLDVYAGAAIVGRASILGYLIKQLQLGATYFEIPLGATRRVPVSVRNSFPSARTVTSVASSAPAHVVSGIAGASLAPGASVVGALTVVGTSLGSQDASVSLAFDSGQGDAQGYGVRVVPATYRLDAGDATPDDGTIDFGEVALGAAPIDRTFTLTNLTATAIPVEYCSAMYAPFALVGACPTEVPAMQSVSLTVRFTPSTLGPAIAPVGLAIPSQRSIVGFVTGTVVDADEPPPGPGGGSGGGCDRIGSGDDPGCNIGGAGSGMLLALLALRRRRRRA